MKKGQIEEGIVERTEFPNKGIVTIEGKHIVIKNALEGQKIRFSLTKVRSDRAEGRLLEVMEASPREKSPDCPHFGSCGGCAYRTLSYDDQLALKEKQVLEVLKDTGCVGVFEGIKPSPRKEGYRNKMEFTFGDEYKGGPMSLGLHVRGSFHDIVTVRGCRIVDEDFRRILLCVLELAGESGLPYYHRLRQEGYFRHLLVRKAAGTGEILVALVTTTKAGPKEALAVDAQLVRRLTALEEEGKLQGRLAGILHTRNDSAADAVIDQGTIVLWGEDHFDETLLGLTFRISPFSFFQTNSLGAEVLYETVRKYSGETRDKRIFDLYSGTGTIAQLLAPVAKSVVGVEIVEEAVEAAKHNAELNHLDNCHFLAGDVLKVVDELEEKPDLIILDPPRDGIHPKALTKIMRFGVERIVYVSCKPTSLARDLKLLEEGGYQAERCCCVDMFPAAAHVETVCLLSKLSDAKNHISVKFDMDEMDVTAAESKATYQEIQEWVREKYGFHVTHLNIAQVKRKNGIIERENYNKSKSEASRQPGCPEEKEQAIEEAMKHFQMII